MAGMQLRGYLLHFLVTDFSDINSAQKKVSAENASVPLGLQLSCSGDLIIRRHTYFTTPFYGKEFHLGNINGLGQWKLGRRK